MRSRFWLIAASLLAVYIIWGSTYLGIRIAVAELPPFSMGAFRFLVAGGLLIGLARLRKEPWPDAVQWKGAAIAGLFFLGFANSAIMVAERTVPSGFAALIAATTPLVLAAMERFRRDGERPGLVGNLGLVLGFCGAAVLLMPAMSGQTSAGAPNDIAILLLAPFFWAYGQTYARRNAMPAGLLMGSGIQALSAGLFDGLAGAVLGEFPRLATSSPSLAAWLAIAYLIVFGSIVAFTAFAYLIREVPPSLASSGAYVNPVVAVFLGATLAHEPVTLPIIAGSVLVVGAVFLLAWPRIAETMKKRVDLKQATSSGT